MQTSHSWSGVAPPLVLKLHDNKNTTKMKNCKECNFLLVRRGNEKVGDFNRRQFCGRSCSAKFNNKLRGKYKPLSYWCDCGRKKHHKAERCHECKKKHTLKIQEERTLNDVSGKGNARIRWSHLRWLARKKMEINNIPKRCKCCGFDLAVEVCHIKDINKFDLKTKVKIVNSLDNLVYLCPNHHVMLDRGLISMEEIEGHERRPRSIRKVSASVFQAEESGSTPDGATNLMEVVGSNPIGDTIMFKYEINENTKQDQNLLIDRKIIENIVDSYYELGKLVEKLGYSLQNL